MTLRIIGIDLAVHAAHKAVILDQASQRFLSGLISFRANPAEMDCLLQQARAGATDEVQLIAVLEATGMSWFTVGTYLVRHGVRVYRVSGQLTADQRRVIQRHAKSDRIDARVLVSLYLACPERLRPLFLPSGPQLELQRACRELQRLTRQIASIKNRLLATDALAWLGLADVLPPYGPQARWVRTHWYDPWRVREAGYATLAQAWQDAAPQQPADTAWIEGLLRKAKEVVALYGQPQRLDYQCLQLGLQREQARLESAEEQAQTLRLGTIRPLYRQLHPQRHLETLRGVGQDSAAVYVAFIGDIHRFPSLADFRGWSGLIPYSRQSGTAQAQGLRITQAGPDLVKSTAFLDANVARLYDPQIAAIYQAQMLRGKHHLQALCACATHLLDRVYTVLRENRPYQLRDPRGQALDKDQARRLCTQVYRVPPEVRRRNNYRLRKARAEQRVEQRYQSRTLKERSKG